MKRLSTPLIALLLALAAASRLSAADPESSFGLAPTAPPPLQPSSSTGLPLIPETVEPAVKPGKSPVPPIGGNKTSMNEDRLKKRVQLRKALTMVEREPDLQALKLRALAAPTDFEQRKLFIDYYTVFCDRITKFDKTIPKAEIDLLRASYTGRYYQSHISPTIDPASFHTKGN